MKGEVVTFTSFSAEQTMALGKRLGNLLDQGDIVGLQGELGSGKTCFTKGIALGLDISSETVITSPSFSLVNEYEGRCTLIHMDIYRLENICAFLSSGLEEYFFQDGVAVVEWADRWPEILPENVILAEFIIEDQNSRAIKLKGFDTRAVEILKELERTD